MFTESNTVEAYLSDLLADLGNPLANKAEEPSPNYLRKPRRTGWHFAAPADIPRQPHELLVEPWLRDALIRLNPEIAAALLSAPPEPLRTPRPPRPPR